jgi:hypothetical protein
MSLVEENRSFLDRIPLLVSTTDEWAENLVEKYTDDNCCWCGRHICVRIGLALTTIAAVVASIGDIIMGLVALFFCCCNAKAREFALDHLEGGFKTLVFCGSIFCPLAVIAYPPLMPEID